MVKKARPYNFALRALIALIGAGTLAACSTARSQEEAREEARFRIREESTTLGKITELWATRLNGYVTDLALSADGSALLVATAPNRDVPNGSRQHEIYRFDAEGEEEWSLAPGAPVKSISLSRDGKVAIVATYDDSITAYDEEGDELWAIEATCKPVMLVRLSKFVCYHDDDAEPGIAFDVYDLNGKKLLSRPAQQDVLSLKVSSDDRNLVIASVGGQVTLYGPDFMPVWQRDLEGEITDVDVTAGPEPRVAVLYRPDFRPKAKEKRSGGRTQRIALFDFSGKRRIEGTPAQSSDQIAFTDDGAGVIVHGNGRQGQYLALFAATSSWKGELRSRWFKSVPHFSDNAVRLLVAPGQVVLGFEENTELSRRSRLISLGVSRGNERWNVPVKTDEGAYLYTDSIAGEGRVIVIGSDDGRVSAFRFE